MANSENLKPIKKGELSKEELKKRQRNGGKKSVEVRAQKKTMREMLDYLLEKEITNNKGEKATTLEAMMTSVIKKAISGDIKANEFVRDTTGQKPVDNVNLLQQDETKEAYLNHLKNIQPNGQNE